MTTWTLMGQRERDKACEAIRQAPDLWRVTLAEPKRTDKQNDTMWQMIGDIMKQRPGWFGPGLDSDDVKQVFLNALFKELRMARNEAGDGYVPLVHRSSKLSYGKFSELLDLIAAWGAREGVAFTKDREPKEAAA